MGHREDLLAGAKRCLVELGYAHTTARDIVKASGTNLSSIGYHFGSKEALLNAAMLEMFEDWAGAVGTSPEGDTPLARFDSMITAVIESVRDNRAMWAASVDVFREAERSPDLLARLAAAHEESRRGSAALIYQEEQDETVGKTVGSLYLTIVSGLMLQLLVDPANAPTAADLTTAMRALTSSGRPPGPAPR